MFKSLSLLSISTAVLLASTQSYGHVLCAPNTPHIKTTHAHGQNYTVPRITTTQHSQRFLQEQRARQQKALANQQRINQQRRVQAQRRQQQDAIRKAQIIKQQQLAARQARAARQRVIQQTASSHTHYVKTGSADQQPIYVQPRVHYVQPTYNPSPVYYTPSRSSISVTIESSENDSNRLRAKHSNKNRHVVRHKKRQHIQRVKHRNAQKQKQHHRKAKQNYRMKRENHQRHQWKSSDNKSGGYRNQMKSTH